MEELKLKKLKKNNRKNIVIGALVLVAITSAATYLSTRAKYQTIDSIPLASGTVSLSKYDLQIIAMYQESDTGTITLNGKKYVELGSNDRMPNGSNYKISSNSFCYIDNKDNHDTGVELTTIDGNHVIQNLKRNEKCYLYFDNIDEIFIAGKSFEIDRTLTTSAQFGVKEEGTGGLYEFTGRDSKKTQFYRGAVTNNYVRLGNETSNYTYWRIVRFDEEGNIRLIYDGTSAHDNGEQSDDRQLTTNFNGTSMYTTAYHGTHAETNVKWINSPIKSYLEGTWMTAFEERLSDKEKLQLATGKFCSDISGSASSYGPRTRLETNKTPSFDCATGDLIRAKVGMLSADEWTFAGGGGYQQTNTSFYLYTGANWWTLSPSYWKGSRAAVFSIHINGFLNSTLVNTTVNIGVRPVMILDKDTLFAGEGTKTNPYTIAN